MRDRKSEIGILRAIGVKEGKIMNLFLLKAIIIGFFGAFLGYFAGLASGSILGEQFTIKVFDVNIFLLALVLAPVLAVMSAYVPATIAARQDPADVLREE